ncbi:hypothetical protein CMQ_5966 [Grosmannia clavigera kw1407]|uniref:Uncharacterized protein n=1 Tax=Grosmannia clavigera (strain kw1407 / UAMH 11150) TaxID=655863 RepID=F0XLC0_GROCL|nr:uncharacterized protein CMQ_5966 [Grosmannia clavigera kw1407]EFX01024.1 hypothetical protein CMQ_5966 [Grosmannia clavigera kw1407]
MASTPLYVDSGGDVAELMGEGARLKKAARTLSLTFATSPDSPLDGSLHPSLQAVKVAVSAPLRTLTRRLTQPLAPKDEQQTITDKQVSTEERLFKEAMKEYESTAKPKYRTGIDPEATHTFKELESVLADALKTSQPTGGAWGRIEKAFQKLGESKENLDSWLGLLPSESEYFSIVCGGLKMVVSVSRPFVYCGELHLPSGSSVLTMKAAARMSHVKDAVMEALLQIPFLLNSAQRVLAIYDKKPTLIALSKSFYVSILTAIGHILHYLRQKSAKKVLKAIVTPTSFEKGLLAKVQAITTARDAFNAEADICQKETLDELAKATAAGNARILDTLHAVIVAANKEYSRVLQVLQHSYNAIEQNLFQIKDHLVDVRETQNRQAIALDEQTEAMKHLMEFMTGNAQVLRTVEALNAPLNDLAGADIRTFRLALLAPKADKEERVAACKTLLRRLDYDLAATSADLLDIMAAALLHMRSQAKPDVVPLYYFCGQHIASGSRGGYQDMVSGVANSLLAQLVTICGETDEEAGVDVRPAIALGKVKHDDVKSVLRRFRAVVLQLPADTIVFCIVDGLSLYLGAQRTEAAAEQLLHGLLRLSRDSKSRKSKPTCTFKLLVTAPYRFNPHVASEIAEEEETLNVPLRLPLSGGFNEMKWHLSIGQLLDETSESE